VDPRVVALRRAARAAVVVPATFAFSLLVIRDAQFTTFAVFGCFALLVMANFGGNRQPRAIAYVVTTLAGAVLVALGTVVSPDAPVGAVVMLAVGFALSFAGVFGGYVLAAQTALLLALVLAVSISAPAADVPARIGGWMLAGVVSTLAGLFVWPTFERTSLRRRAAEACDDVADLIEGLHVGPPGGQVAALQQTSRTAIEAMRSEYARTTMRPAGPTRRDRAFVELMSQLAEVVDLSERLANTHGLGCVRASPKGAGWSRRRVRLFAEAPRSSPVGNAPTSMPLLRHGARTDQRSTAGRRLSYGVAAHPTMFSSASKPTTRCVWSHTSRSGSLRTR
jgi:uncharacterized membrane protein YccC